MSCLKLLDLYKLYESSDSFEKELYGGLYKLYGGRKLIKESKKETEWFIETLYKIYLAEQKYVDEKNIFYKKNVEIINELKLLRENGKYDGWKYREYEDMFSLFKKKYLWDNLLYLCILNLKKVEDLRLGYLNDSLYNNFMVTLYCKSGHMLSKVSFDFTLDNDLLFDNVRMNIIDIYMSLRYNMAKNERFYINRMSLKLYNDKLINIFHKVSLRMG